MTIAFAYLIIVMVMLSAFAVRTPDQDIRTVVFLSIFWPLSLFVMLMLSILWSVKWDFNVADTTMPKMFGFRKPQDGWPGFAITIFHNELQFWKKR